MHKLIHLPRYSLFRGAAARFSARCSSNSSIPSANHYLIGWPGKFRLPINVLIRNLGESQYISKAYEHFIEKNVWLDFINVYRRKLVKNPVSVLGVEFVEICQLFERLLEIEDQNLSNPGLNKELREIQIDLEGRLFKAMIFDAEKELKDVIQSFQTIRSVSDLTHPHKWYPFARIIKRKIIFHGGPTNSGKVGHCCFIDCMKSMLLTRLVAADLRSTSAPAQC